MHECYPPPPNLQPGLPAAWTREAPLVQTQHLAALTHLGGKESLPMLRACRDQPSGITSEP